MILGIGIGIPFGRRGGIDAQAKAAFDSLIAAGFTCPQGLIGINAAFKTIKTIYGTSDITTAISFFGDPSLSYQIGTGSGTTLGQAIRTLPNLVDTTRATDAVQTTAASQPLLLLHDGYNYYQAVGVINNQVSTPNAAANQITGDIDIKVELINYSAQSINNAGFLSKSTSGGVGSYVFTSQVSGTKTLGFRFWQVGVKAYNSTAESTITNGWVRVTRNQTTGDVIFYQSTDGTNWTQIGATVSGVTGAMENGNEILNVGTFAANGTPFLGKIKRVLISNAINGSAVVDFNPNQYNPATSQTQWTSGTGEVWTINTGNSKTGFKGVLVDRNTMQSNGTSTSLRVAGINIISEAFTLYTSFRKFNNSAGAENIFELGIGATSNAGINIEANRFAGFESSNIFANVGRYNNNFSNNSLLLGIRTSVYNINNANEAIPYLFNDAVISPTGSSAANNNTSAVNATDINLFSTNNGVSNFSQINLNTVILSLSENNSTIRTAMYNYIRSINNNAF